VLFRLKEQWFKATTSSFLVVAMRAKHNVKSLLSFKGTRRRLWLYGSSQV